jgi:cytoskeletal protein CcmA (bactofilin family)
VALFKRDESTHDEASTATAGPLPSPEPRSSTHHSRNSGGGKSEVANIGKSIAIKGDLTGNEDISVEGKVDGKVDLPNNQLTIGANGIVHAEVKAKSVIVIGHISGNVNGIERIEIQATGVVDGDVTSPRLVVAEGAVLNGSIHMSQKDSAPATAAPASPGPEVLKTA